MDSPHNASPTRWRAIAGGLAATVVVGLLAALLVHNGAQRSPVASATSTPPPTPTPCPPQPPETPLLSNGCPAATPGQQPAFLQPGEIPIVAPSNPQIVYRVVKNAPQRSTDGGKTYSALSKPKTDITPVDDTSISVSPIDPTHVFLTISGQKNGQGCLPPTPSNGSLALHGGTLFSGYTECSEQFYSANSGQTWARMNLPGGDVLGGTNLFRVVQGPYQASAYIFQAQGTRLYAGAGFATQGGSILASFGARLLTSVDGGATWSLLDRPIISAGLIACDFAASPSGSTIYAAVTNQSCGGEGLPAMSLWRSDNAGQSWAKVSNLPSPAEGGMVVSNSGALYIFEPAAQPISHSMIVSQEPKYALVSVDRGVSFLSAPSSGIPGASSKTSLVGPVAILSDGSVLYSIAPSGSASALFSWKVGAQSWTKVAPTPSATLGSVIVTPQAGGGDILTITDSSGGITTITVSG